MCRGRVFDALAEEAHLYAFDKIIGLGMYGLCMDASLPESPHRWRRHARATLTGQGRLAMVDDGRPGGIPVGGAMCRTPALWASSRGLRTLVSPP